MRRASHLPFAVLVCGVAAGSGACSDDDGPPPVELRGASGEVSIRVALEPFEIAIKDGNGREVLRTLGGGGDGDGYGAPAATRDDGPDGITVIPGWDGYNPDERDWHHGAKARLVAQSGTEGAIFELGAGPGAITVEIAIEGAKVRLKTTARAELPPEDAWNKTTLAFALRADEHFFGLGERYATVDHRGVSMYSWAEEGGAGKGEKVPHAEDNPFPNGPSMTYFPVPFFFSTAGYAMHLATTYRTETHFGSKRQDAWRIATNTTSLETIIYVHEDPRRSLDDFTRDTGRPFVPATWVFGPRRRVGNRDMASGIEEWRLLREKKVPTTGLDDAVHFLPARSELGREEELRQWVETAHANGFKVMAYNNPYVSMSIERAREDLAHGAANGLFAKNPDGTIGETFFISGEPQTLATIDLTKPEGVTWFQDLLRRTLALGYDGWMHDFGEYVRRPWTFGDGRRGDEVHNDYPVLSAKAAHDLLVQEKPNDFLFFVRSGYTGTSQYVPAVWGGDPEATFDETQGLPAMLRGGLNLGMSGVPLWGSDVTGFKCITDFPYDKEMYLRWAEVGAVSPIMMEQNACANPLMRRTKWKLWDDEETIEVYAAMARLHTRLAPYFELLAREAHATGMPIMRHPFLLHPKEPEAWSIDSAFYLGPSLYAAPVVERGVTVKETWLPPGKYVDLVDLVEYEGGRRVALPAPLGKLPLLLKDGGIVPMLDETIETLAPATEPGIVTPETVKDVLDVVVALSPGMDARITLADGSELVARRGAGAASPGRVQIASELLAASSVAHEDLVLEARGPVPRRVRWDVHRLR
jgi:sulfoquinovosidase